MQKIGMSLIALVTAAGGFFLVQYAAADDAPGAVLIGIGVVIGAVLLGVLAFRRQAGDRSPQ